MVRRRRPDLLQRACRRQALGLYRTPEWAADGPGIGPAVQDGPQHFHFAPACISVLADVAIEAQRAVLLALEQTVLLQEVYRQDRGMAAVTTAQRQRAISQIRQFPDRPPADGDDLSCPADVRVAHRQRTASVAAPLVGLQVSQVRVPRDINAWQRILG